MFAGVVYCSLQKLIRNIFVPGIAPFLQHGIARRIEQIYRRPGNAFYEHSAARQSVSLVGTDALSAISVLAGHGGGSLELCA
jgi:hypothetical protein